LSYCKTQFVTKNQPSLAVMYLIAYFLGHPVQHLVWRKWIAPVRISMLLCYLFWQYFMVLSCFFILWTNLFWVCMFLFHSETSVSTYLLYVNDLIL